MVLATLLVFPHWAWARNTQAQANEWAKTVTSGHKERTTTLQFYFHDTLSGKYPTAVRVAQPIQKNFKPTGFGVLMMADDPLTVGPDPGLCGSACQDELGLVMVMSYTFTNGAYNGGTISIMGRNSTMQPMRDIPVVGGTGLFRKARGYAQAHTYWINFNTGDAIVGYNVTIVN